MRKLVKMALIAGAAGASAGAVQAFRRDESGEVVAQRALRAAGEAAAVGALIGLVLDRRDRKRLAKKRATLAAGLTTSGLMEAARSARPAIEAAIESARPHFEHAVESARPRVEQAVGAARPRLERAASVARERALEAADAARPAIEHAVDVARERAAELSSRAA